MKRKFKKLELKSIPFTKLLKLELPELADSVISVLEKHNPEELQTQDVLDLLIAEKPQINLMTYRHGINPFNAKIAAEKDKIFLYVSTINFELHKVVKENNQENQLHRAVVKLAVDTYLQKLRSSKNDTIILRKVEQFLHEIKTSTDLNTALSALNLSEDVTKLQLSLFDARELLISKYELISKRSQESTSDIAAPVVYAIKNVIKEVELLRAKNSEIDYKDLFNELNEVIGAFRGNISRREISNKRKAELKKAQESGGVIENLRMDIKAGGSNESTEEIPTDKMTTPSVSMTSTNGEVSPKVEKTSMNGFKEGLNVDFDQSIDQKKTVASSSKNMQLPDLNDEA